MSKYLCCCQNSPFLNLDFWGGGGGYSQLKHWFTSSVLLCRRCDLRGYLRFKYRINSYTEPWRQYNSNNPSSLNAYIRLPRSYVQIFPFKVNKYSTFIFLKRARCPGLRGGADCPKQRQEQVFLTAQSGCRSVMLKLRNNQPVRGVCYVAGQWAGAGRCVPIWR